MATSRNKYPTIDDPMRTHVYIGYCEKDKEVVEMLWNAYNSAVPEFKSSSRHRLVTSEVAQNIKASIDFAHKLVFYVSGDYDEDGLSRIEIKAAKKKVKYFGKESVVVLVKQDVEEKHLTRFQQFTVIRLEGPPDFSKEYLEEKKLLAFELKPDLKTMPKGNIGVGVAYTYFYGFLQLVLTDVRAQLEKKTKELGLDSNHVVKKFLIIIPETVNCPPRVPESDILKQTKNTTTVYAARAGREKREYTLPIYKLTPDVRGKEPFYFICDMPACLYALYEAYDVGAVGSTLDELYEARNEFCYTLKALLNHADNKAKYADQWEMLFWRDSKENPKQEKLSDFLYQEITQKSLTTENISTENKSTENISTPVQETVQAKTYIVEEGKAHNNPVYRHHNTYPRISTGKHRGLCVIINNSTFPKHPNLKRTGASKENERLEELFQFLKFEVTIYKDQTYDEMMNCLKIYQSADHSKYDAFVCCILSHGDRGYVASSDGISVAISDVMKLFYETEPKCQSLRGKPKLFFIEACQGSGETIPGAALSPQAEPDDADTTHVADACSTEALTYASLIPSSVNFIVSYATLPHNVAWAHKVSGGLYIDALCKCLKKDQEIDMVLRKVSSKVEKLVERYAAEDKCEYTIQRPFHVVLTGDKLLFLAE